MRDAGDLLDNTPPRLGARYPALGWAGAAVLLAGLAACILGIFALTSPERIGQLTKWYMGYRADGDPGHAARAAIILPYCGNFVLCGLGVFFLAWLGRLFPEARKRVASPPARIEAPLAVLLYLALAWVAYSFGMRQFGAYDMSSVYDLGWRMRLGQLPYQDFVYTHIPGFALVAKYAFKLFGDTLASFMLMNSLIILGLSLAQHLMLRRLGLSFPAALAAVMAAQGLTSVLVGHIYHSSLTLLVAITYVISSLLFVKFPRGLYAQAGFILIQAVLLTMKPNTAFAVIAAVSLVLLLHGPTRLRSLACLAASALLVWVVLDASGLPVARQLMVYQGLAKSRSSLAFFLPPEYIVYDRESAAALYGILWLMFTYLIVASGLVRGLTDAVLKRSLDERTACCAVLAVSALAGIYPLGTDWDFKFISVSLSAVSVCLLGLVSPPPRTWRLPDPRTMSAALLVGLAALGVTIGAARYRNLLVGEGAFFEFKELAPVTDNAFFNGLMTTEKFRTLIGSITRVLATCPSRNVFFGPRLEVMYGAFGVPSPLHLPVWWHPGSSFLPEQEKDIVEAWKNDGMDLAIFSHDTDPPHPGPDMTRMPAELETYIKAEYRHYTAPGIDLFVRKASPCDVEGLVASGFLRSAG